MELVEKKEAAIQVLIRQREAMSNRCVELEVEVAALQKELQSLKEREENKSEENVSKPTPA